LISRHTRVLIAATKWWAPAARMAIALVQNGCRVSALCPAHHPLTLVSGLERVLRYRGLDSVGSLRQAVSGNPCDIIVPCDDGVVAQLHALHREGPSLRKLIEASLGPASSYVITSHRHRLLKVATELGIPVPTTKMVTSIDDVAAWYRDVAPLGVVKVDGESGGNGVRICGSLAESIAAWRDLGARPGLATACKRLAINRDPLALWTRQHAPDQEITIQRFVDGRPANSMFASLNGKLIAVLSVVVLAADGPTGAAMIVRKLNDPRLANNASLIAERLKLTGFYGLDYVLDANTGVPQLIEMNPRSTQLGHLEFTDQRSLVTEFCAAFRGQAAVNPHRPIPGDTVALFPASLAILHTHHARVDAAYLDEPMEEPALVEELKRDPWPERQWLSRMYHALRPFRRTPAIDFEAFGGAPLAD